MRAPLTIAGREIRAGKLERLEIPVARMFTQQMLHLPVVVVHGKLEGPTTWITAAIHGDEISGTEIARRVLATVSPKTIRGTLIVVPVVNVWGFLEMSRYLPDRRDLNRSFPGARVGSLAAQLARLLMLEVVRPGSYGIDLHAGSHHRTNLPQVRGSLEDPRVRDMARAFAAPATIDSQYRSGSLRAAAARHDIPCLLFEAGTTLRMERETVITGTNGVLRVLKHLGMIDEAPHATGNTIISRRTSWLRASRSGIAQLEVTLGDHVTAGQQIGVIRDTFGDVTSRIRSRLSGLIIGQVENPLVNRGDALVHVADVETEDYPSPPSSDASSSP
jgi:predicted deacylase